MPQPNYSADGSDYDSFDESDTESITPADSPPPSKQDDVVIAVMGATGSGKSSFIQLLTGQDVKVGNSLNSETEDIQVVPFLDPTSKRRIIVVDTPGFDDSRAGKTDTEILKTITEFLLSEYDKDRKLNGLVYVQRISDPRFGGQSTRNLRTFRGLCGTDNFKNVVVLTTFWDRVDNEAEGVAREGQLKSEFFKDIVAGGGRFMRHDRTVQSAHKVLQEIIPLPPTHVEIQKEIRVEGKELEDTAAGSMHREEIQRLIDKHKAEMAEVKAEMKAAKQLSEETKRELRVERDKLKSALERWENEGSDLQKGLDDEKQHRGRLEKEAAEAREEHKKWRENSELKWNKEFTAQTEKHGEALKGMQQKFNEESKARDEERRRQAELLLQEKRQREEAQRELDAEQNKSFVSKALSLADALLVPMILTAPGFAMAGATLDVLSGGRKKQRRPW